MSWSIDAEIDRVATMEGDRAETCGHQLVGEGHVGIVTVTRYISML